MISSPLCILIVAGSASAFVAPFSQPSALQRTAMVAASAFGAPMDQVVDCAETGECYVEEMSSMIQELNDLNKECQGNLDEEECDLEAITTRNSLQVSLAQKIIIAEEATIMEECDFNAMWEMDDACLNTGMHDIPTSVMDEVYLDRIVKCAEEGNCPVEEISDMIRELNRMNQECGDHNSRECSLHAMEARNLLKTALGHQALMAQAREHP